MHAALGEDDFTLIHALQLRPRATWTELAGVLGAAAPTLAARWERLRDEGLSWVSVYPTVAAGHDGRVSALVEIDVAPGTLPAVCQILDADPRVGSIEYAARGRDLILTVFADDFSSLSTMLLDELATLPGVVSSRAHLASQVHLEGSGWRLDALDPTQLAALEALPVPVGGASGSADTVDLTGPVHGPLLAALGRDGRASAAQLAVTLGRPDSTVRRQLAALLRSGSVSLRCEVAQLRTRWPVCVTWWCRVPSANHDAAVRALAREPRVRLCMSLTGPANFLVTMWTASLGDLTATQGRLEALLFPGEIVDTSVILRTRKRLGWLLHPDGRSTGTVVPVGAPPLPG